MSLVHRDSIKTVNGSWIVQTEPTKAGNVPRILLLRPGETVPEFVHYNDQISSFVDEKGSPIEELNNGQIEHIKASEFTV